MFGFKHPPKILNWFFPSFLWRVSTKKKELYLTFDDGPSPHSTKWIIEKLVLKLIAEGIKVSNAETLVLGFSFKENCPDIRNTKTIDIIRNLRKYNINPTIVDPSADKDECKRIFEIELKNEIPDKKFDIIIVAVGHDEFKLIKSDEWLKLKTDKGIFLDLKNIIPRSLSPMRI